MNTKSIYLVCLFSLLILMSCSKRETRRILVVHSYEETYAGYVDFNREIIHDFREEGIEPEIRFIYLDCETYQAKEELERMTRMLDSVKGWKPEIILVNDDQATYSLLKSEHPVVSETPVVFGGVNYPNWDLIHKYSNVTGFHDKIDFKSNINFIKQLLGDRTGIFTMHDSTYLDCQIAEDACEQLKGEKVAAFISQKMTPQEWKRLNDEGYTFLSGVKVRTGESNAGLIWALSKYMNGRCHLQIKRDFTTVSISNVCSSPSLTVINEGFCCGEQLLGGYMTTMPIQVKEEAGAAVRILRGAHPSDIPVDESRKEYVMDWNVMKQRGITVKQVPEYCKILNIPFQKQYPALWMGIVVLLSTVLLVMFIYLFFLYRREHQRKRRTQLALADEKETLALAIQGGDTFVWKLEEGQFICEDAFWDSLGIEPKVLMVKDIFAYIHPDHLKRFKSYQRKVLLARKECMQLLCDFNGKGYQWWEFRYTTTHLPSGGIKTTGLLLNIQHVKDREQELENARRLAEKAELKQSFLANMSHEIRTPLNAIVGFSNILVTCEEEVTEEERSEYVETINRNSDLLLKLINDILELSRIESGYMSFEYGKYKVEDIVNDTYQTHQVLVPGNLQFLKKEDLSVSLEVDVDKGRLAQVLTNFLNNASKFTSEGYIELGYTYLSEEHAVSIYVEDSGQGIPYEEQKMIFSRFYKQDEFAQGVGLGLSICQVIIGKLGGRIELWSEPGEGSRFTVILPCRLIS